MTPALDDFVVQHKSLCSQVSRAPACVGRRLAAAPTRRLAPAADRRRAVRARGRVGAGRSVGVTQLDTLKVVNACGRGRRGEGKRFREGRAATGEGKRGETHAPRLEILVLMRLGTRRGTAERRSGSRRRPSCSFPSAAVRVPRGHVLGLDDDEAVAAPLAHVGEG